jgi:hypothetical protein
VTGTPVLTRSISIPTRWRMVEATTFAHLDATTVRSLEARKRGFHGPVMTCLPSMESMSWSIGNLEQIPSGKLSHNYGKSPFLVGKLTISMAIFNSYVWHNQRVQICSLMKPSWNSAAGNGQRPGLVPSDCRAGHLPCCGSSGFNVRATKIWCTIDMQNVTKKSPNFQNVGWFWWIQDPDALVTSMSISGRECLTHQLWDSVTCQHAWRLDWKLSDSLYFSDTDLFCRCYWTLGRNLLKTFNWFEFWGSQVLKHFETTGVWYVCVFHSPTWDAAPQRLPWGNSQRIEAPFSDVPVSCIKLWHMIQLYMVYIW